MNRLNGRQHIYSYTGSLIIRSRLATWSFLHTNYNPTGCPSTDIRNTVLVINNKFQTNRSSLKITVQQNVQSLIFTTQCMSYTTSSILNHCRHAVQLDLLQLPTGRPRTIQGTTRACRALVDSIQTGTISAIWVDAQSMRGTGAAWFTAPEGNNSWLNTTWSTSVDVRCNVMAYCCINIRMEDIRLASLCNCNTAYRVSRRFMTCSHSAGG